MIAALVVLPVLAVLETGGFATTVTRLWTRDALSVDPFAISVGVAIGFLGIGLGSPGQPHIIVRYLSIADPKQLRYSAVVGTIWNVVMGIGAVSVGMVARLYFQTAADLPGGDVETVYPLLAQQHLPPLLFGVIVASIFAAIMSTADSQLLVAASALVRDVYENVLRVGRPVPQRSLVLLSRLAVALLVVIAVIVGLVADQLVFWLVLFSWAGLGAALGPTSLLALFWKRTTRAGVLAGLVSGAATVVVWYFVPVLKSRLYELVPAFFVGLVATIVVSLMTKPPEEAEKMMEAMKDSEK
jgi:Na+/proline symporter